MSNQTSSAEAPTLPRQHALAGAPAPQQPIPPGGGDCSRCGGAFLSDDDERAPTLPYIAPVFFGQPLPKWPADQPLPAHVALGSTDATKNERTPRGSR